MTQPIVYIDTSSIREGKLEELEIAMRNLAAFVEANVPQLIRYGFFLDKSGTQMSVVAIHPDSASLEFHMEIGGAEFQRFAHLIDLSRIEVYGDVSDAVLERLHQKARTLGTGTVTVHDFFSGFIREQEG